MSELILEQRISSIEIAIGMLSRDTERRLAALEHPAPPVVATAEIPEFPTKLHCDLCGDSVCRHGGGMFEFKRNWMFICADCKARIIAYDNE